MRQISGFFAVILCASLPCAALAEVTTFKRVKVGDSLPGKRITVQIDPAAQAAYLAALPKVDPNPVHEPPPEEATAKADRDGDGAPAAAPASSYAWFWDTVPAGLSEVSGRFDLALSTLSAGPKGQSVNAPRLQHM